MLHSSVCPEYHRDLCRDASDEPRCEIESIRSLIKEGSPVKMKISEPSPVLKRSDLFRPDVESGRNNN
jgi:hypothetical protein